MNAELSAQDNRPALLDHRGVLLEICEATTAVDVRSFELADVQEIRERLVPTCLELAQRAKHVLRELLIVEDQPHGADDTEESGTWSQRPLSQMCFVARLEISQQEEELYKVAQDSESPSSDPNKLISRRDRCLLSCDSSLRRTKKALAAVEAAIAQTVGVSALQCDDEDLAIALVVRREYARFLGEGEPEAGETPQELVKQVRSVGTRIAVLIGRKAYAWMRLKDRLLFRGLQKTILGWLADPERSLEGGKRILSDFSTATRMLSMVNHRSELRRHDALCLENAIADLQAGTSPRTVLSRNGTLFGLDRDLDRLLSGEQERDARGVQKLLTQLHQTIQGGFQP